MTAPAGRGAILRAAPLIGICLVLIGLLSGCPRAPEQAYKTQIFTLGTMVDISLWGVDDQRAAEAVRAVEATLSEIHTRWHAWEPGELTRLNDRLAAGETAGAPADLIAALEESRLLAQRSDHLFNPAIGRLVSLWGFHSSEAPGGPPPDDDEIERLVQADPSMNDLVIEDGRITSANPVVQLDLGAYAKGYGLDRAIETLRGLGIENAIVNAGGDLRAIGSHGERPWRIGIRHPADSGIIASVETHADESVFTSGDYERHFHYEGRHYHHILDPRTGYPAEGTVSVTVIHDNASAADAAATALFIAGPAGWRDIAQRMEIAQVMLIDADMNVHMSPAMAERIRFEVEPAPSVVVEPP